VKRIKPSEIRLAQANAGEHRLTEDQQDRSYSVKPYRSAPKIGEDEQDRRADLQRDMEDDMRAELDINHPPEHSWRHRAKRDADPTQRYACSHEDCVTASAGPLSWAEWMQHQAESGHWICHDIADPLWAEVEREFEAALGEGRN
jgi:hypothetical protein